MPGDGKAAYRAPFDLQGKRWARTEAKWNIKP
jgi:hypothetical protein